MEEADAIDTIQQAWQDVISRDEWAPGEPALGCARIDGYAKEDLPIEIVLDGNGKFVTARPFSG